MDDVSTLTNHFLIAMPNLADPNFSRTVTLICEHNSEGAMGLTINRQMDLNLKDIIDQMGIELVDDKFDMPIFQGGPVQHQRGFVLHEPLGNWESTLPVTDRLGVSTSKDILYSLAKGEGPKYSLLALGYAGWGPGQLEQEMLDNAWLSGPADNDIIFRAPVHQRWQRAAQRLGVDLSTLSGSTGHA